MGNNTLTRDLYNTVSLRVSRAGGNTSYAGEEEQKKTGKLHPLVDPAGYGIIRKSLPRYVELPNGTFHNIAGVPMPVETSFDTTGSMGRNVALAFASLPKLYELLASGANPVLGRYDVQIANGIFGDRCDNYVAARTQFEMAEKIAEQLTLMVPEGGGCGNGGEDPEYLLFGGAYLTQAFIREYGLKGYHFMVTDEPGHDDVDKEGLIRVFSEKVFDVLKENERMIDKRNMPSTQKIVNDLKEYWHAFAVIAGNPDYSVKSFWEECYGKDRVISIESTLSLPYLEAVLIGLTEGVIHLSGVANYLTSVGCSRDMARDLQRAVANIPTGLQTQEPNFKKIPKRGGVYAKKRDLWPMAEGTNSPAAKEKSMWL
jgi:hypothetical protein